MRTALLKFFIEILSLTICIGLVFTSIFKILPNNRHTETSSNIMIDNKQEDMNNIDGMYSYIFKKFRELDTFNEYRLKRKNPLTQIYEFDPYYADQYDLADYINCTEKQIKILHDFEPKEMSENLTHKYYYEVTRIYHALCDKNYCHVKKNSPGNLLKQILETSDQEIYFHSEKFIEKISNSLHGTRDVKSHAYRHQRIVIKDFLGIDVNSSILKLGDFIFEAKNGVIQKYKYEGSVVGILLDLGRSIWAKYKNVYFGETPNLIKIIEYIIKYNLYKINPEIDFQRIPFTRDVEELIIKVLQYVKILIHPVLRDHDYSLKVPDFYQDKIVASNNMEIKNYDIVNLHELLEYFFAKKLFYIDSKLITKIRYFNISNTEKIDDTEGDQTLYEVCSK